MVDQGTWLLALWLEQQKAKERENEQRQELRLELPMSEHPSPDVLEPPKPKRVVEIRL